MAFIKENRLGGAFLWSVDLDDFTGEWCQQGRFPLLNAIKNFLKPSKLTSSTSTISVKSRNKIIFLLILSFLNSIFL